MLDDVLRCIRGHRENNKLLQELKRELTGV